MATVTNFRSDARITEAQRQVLRDFSCSLGADILDLAGKLGVDVEFRDLPLDEFGFLEEFADVVGGAKFRVVVNSALSPATQKFTVAHELGHFVLHRGSSDLNFRLARRHRERDKYEYSDAERPEEFEADAFATNLLMPAHLVRKAVASGVDTIKSLSLRFGVSERAMERRVHELGIVLRKHRLAARLEALSDPHDLLGWSRVA